MRLVTWSLGHRRNGDHCPDGMVAALTELDPDIAIVTDHARRAARTPLLAALARAGLRHCLATAPGPHRGSMLLASRRELEPGTLDARGDGAPMRPNLLHVRAPAGALEVIGLSIHDCGDEPGARAACWDWLRRAATLLRQRRAVLIGNFAPGTAGPPNGDAQQFRGLVHQGWQCALPASGPSAPAGGGTLRLDQALLSPSVQRIDARYALAAAGLRLSGAQGSPSEQPVLVVDVQ